MTDVAFVGAAYAIVVGGIAAYAYGLTRRSRAARRRLDALDARRTARAGGGPATAVAGDGGSPGTQG